MMSGTTNGGSALTDLSEIPAVSLWRSLDKSQLIKWTVYSLLIVNWGFYAVEEYAMATHTLRQGGSFLDWTEAFATTIDNFAWFGLLFMLELETYMLDESLEKPWVKWSVHGLRLVCYAFLAHTVYARANALTDTLEVRVDPAVTHLCQVADTEHSFGANYRYEIITGVNCAALSGDSVFYRLEPTVLTDRAGFALEKKHVWIDMLDAVVWLLVVWAIELAVWLQNRGITGGPLMVVSHAARVGYVVLFGHAAFWVWNGHWVWAWDQFLWIAGFWAIENNLSEWREELRGTAGSTQGS